MQFRTTPGVNECLSFISFNGKTSFCAIFKVMRLFKILKGSCVFVVVGQIEDAKNTRYKFKHSTFSD